MKRYDLELFSLSGDKLAEEEGFEPSSPGLPVKRFSRPPHSTTLPPLRILGATLLHVLIFKQLCPTLSAEKIFAILALMAER